MNSKIYLVPVIVFGMFLSIILGLQSQWGNTAAISCVIVLFLSVLVLGYVLNDIFQRYHEKEVLQQKYHEEYIKSIDSIKLENSKVITALDNHIKELITDLDNHIKEYLGDNINELLITLDTLNNSVEGINDGVMLLDTSLNNEFEEIKRIKRKLDTMYDEKIKDMNINDFTTFVKESKRFVDGLDSRLKKEREDNIKLIQQALEQYQNVCDNFIRQSARLNNEDIKLLKKISGELK